MLLIRVRLSGYELPKGHIEAGETDEQAAMRELQEETGLTAPVQIHQGLGEIHYSFSHRKATHHKTVRYFAASTNAPVFRARPSGTRELRWMTREEIDDFPLVNDNLRPILQRAFAVLEALDGTSR